MNKPIHPFLFSAYFVLALLGLNIEQVRLSAALRPLAAALLLAGLLWAALRLWLREAPRAALAASLLLGLFFTYGHIYQALEQAGIGLGRHRTLLPLWLALAAGGLAWVARSRGSRETATRALNLIGLAALAFPLWQVGSFELRLLAGEAPRLVEQPGLQSLSLPPGQAPDVYFIILDEYTRQDLLAEVFAHDNAPFLEALRGLGFQVIECAQSNYAQTELVLSSTLNLDYLEALDPRFAEGTADHALLRRLIQDSLVERAFRQMGYQVVAFETGFPFSEFDDADHYLSPGGDARAGLTPFEVLLFKSSAGLALSDAAARLPDLLNIQAQPLEQKRQQVRFDFEQLGQLPQATAAIPGPKFVFAHILLPHPPFVFGPDGQAVDYPETLDEAAYAAAYRDQVLYLNGRLLEILQAILANSSTPPVIILQGDTGPGRVSHAGRMAILSAFYLPGSQASYLPPGLTPVNNFRLVFDAYFSAQLGRLPEASYFSPYTAPFEFEVIPNTCAGE